MSHSFDLTAYLLDELSEAERAELELALAADPELRAELGVVRELHGGIRGLLARETGPEPRETAPVPFPAKSAAEARDTFRPLAFFGRPGGFAALVACATLVGVLTIFYDAPRPDRREAMAPVAESKALLKMEKRPEKSFATGGLRRTDAAETGPGTKPVPSAVSGAKLAAVVDTPPAPPAIRTPGAVPARLDPSVTASATVAGKPAAGVGITAGTPVDFDREYVFRGAERNRTGSVMTVASRASDPGLLPEAIADEFLSDGAAPAGRFPGEKPGGAAGISGSRRLRGARFDAGATEQPFLSATANPLSTFSVDVNTASYALARRCVNEGGSPPPESVRIEEWLNNFSYSYPVPDADAPVAIAVEGSDCPWNPEHRLVRIGLRARSVAMEKRPPSNLVFLVDTSGSMSPQDRLPLAQESLLKLLERLDERDSVGIVTYAGNSGIAAEPTRCDAAGKKKLEAVILGLGAGGGTNGEAGLREAYALARRHALPDGVNRVVLATDGDFNVGLSGTGELVALAKAEAKKKTFLTVLGFGRSGLNADLMKQLSVKADGNHFYIDSLKEGERVLAQKLTGTLVTVARDVKLQIDFNPARVASYRLIGYDTRRLANEDFNDDAKDAGEMGAGHTVTALYEIVPVGAKPPVDESRYAEKKPADEKPAVPVSDEWLTVKVRAQPPGGGKSVLIERPLAASGMVSLDKASPDQVFAAAVVEAGLFFRKSSHRGASDLAGALELLAKPGVVGDDPDRKEFADLLKRARHFRDN